MLSSVASLLGVRVERLSTTAEPRTVGDGSAVAVELLIADDPSAKSAEEAATELVELGAGRLSYELLVPVDSVRHSPRDLERPRTALASSLDALGWAAGAVLVLGAAWIATAVHGRHRLAAKRSYAHGALEMTGPIGDGLEGTEPDWRGEGTGGGRTPLQEWSDDADAEPSRWERPL